MNPIDYYKLFTTLQTSLASTPLWAAMESTQENSPWHREANVAVHTQMVVDCYVKQIDKHASQWTRADMLGAISCLFHDIGKPSSEIIKHSPERGEYRAYHGHELISARMFETYAIQHIKYLTPADVFIVGWMIEHHMPWSITDSKKLANIKKTAEVFIGVNVYTNCLLADQYGRIADDQLLKNKNAQEWIQRFLDIPDVTLDHRQPLTMFIPVGASGSGKSTILKTLTQTFYNKIDVFSLDVLRHQLYHPTDYKQAFADSVNCPEFTNKANAAFIATVKAAVHQGHHVYVDNTNLTKKRRAMYIDAAKRAKMNVACIVMPIDLPTIIDRQSTRLDKQVPTEAVVRQYNSIQWPSLGECDEIIVANTK